MDTKKAKALAKRISNKIRQSVCIEESLWYYDDGRSNIYYKLIYFTDGIECEIERFRTFYELTKWAGGKWNV
jgi:hypothetical protein